MKLSVRDMTMTAMMTALICIAGPLSIFIGPVPISLASFAVCLAGAVLGAERGAMAAGLYLLIGLVGVPVFSGFTGGLPKLIGVTGGYLAGYLPCAWLSGMGMKRENESGKRHWRLPAFMVLGTAVLYLIGTAWFMFLTRNGLVASLGLCVVPFLPGDAVKITAASLLAAPVRRAIRRQ